MWFFPHKIMRLFYVKVGSPNHLLDLSGSSSVCVCVLCVITVCILLQES